MVPPFSFITFIYALTSFPQDSATGSPPGDLVSVPGPRGVWWGWPSTKVTTTLPCLPESPKGGESGVAVAVMRSS